MSSAYETLLLHQPQNAKIRASASTIPWRRSGETVEIYWVKRSIELPFMAGFHAFPGGGLAASDPAVPLFGAPTDFNGATRTRPGPDVDADELARLATDEVPGLLACALRELFEEVGWLPTTPRVPGLDLKETRQALQAGRLDLAHWLKENDLALDVSRLRFAGRWLTPPLGPIRFDNRFFLLEWRGDDAALEVDSRELESGEWLRPEAALALWHDYRITASPPILHLLRVLADAEPTSNDRRFCDTRDADLGPLRLIEPRPGVIVFPLRTPTLPPAAYTNTFLLGRERAILVDPATPFLDEQDRLLEALTAFESRGGEVLEIWLTHHHPDHVGAVQRLRSERSLKVAAHLDSVAPLADRGIVVDRLLEDNEIVELGGARPFRVRVLHTPGHTRGHLAFFAETAGTLIAGDLVAGFSTIVIDPPEGDMDCYLASLKRVRALNARAIFPSHGWIDLNPENKLRDLIAHRLERESKVESAWHDGARTLQALAERAYADSPGAPLAIAERQVAAHVERLRRHGRIA